MLEENKTVVRRLVEEIQNQHHLERMEEFFDPNFVNHLEDPDASLEFNALERSRLFFRQLFAAFPDLHATIQDQVAEEDKVVTHKIFRGTHQGEFMGVAPTGKQIEFAVIDILRLENGKVVEHSAVQDQLALMQQVGILPSPEQVQP